jgi:hypothetical protein
MLLEVEMLDNQFIKVNIPQRSHLYPLQPLLLGTAFTESFTSYVTRLAAIHQVPTGILLAQELAPKINRYKGPKPDSLSQLFFHIFFNLTGAWNGTGTMALEPLLILQELTQQPTLKYLTLIPWKNVLPTRNLLRKYKAWCPLCYSEWSNNGIPLYEPLIWSISVVEICHIHDSPLMTHCPNCGKDIFFLAWNTRNGFCSRCHHWLGTACSILESPFYNTQNKQWHNFVAQQVGELIAQTPYLIEPPRRESVAKAIDKCINIATKGNASVFAKQMYLSQTVPRDWRIGKALPQLNKLLRVCYRLSISLVDIYLDNLDINDSIVLKDLPLCEQYFKTNRPFDADKVQEFLEIHLESNPPQPLKQLAIKIGYDPADLYRHLPDLCRQISKRYKLHNKSNSKPRV